MVERKPDSAQIRDFLAGLEKQTWLRGGERDWWPKFVFHYTDLLNAVSVLRDDCLFSRSLAEQQGKLVVSSGSRSELARTDSAITNCVRLYFRPRTPTQFYAEGIRSRDSLSRSRYPDAHCPVPVFFLFDSTAILTRGDCKFSDGGLNSPSYRILSTAAELALLPWKEIYHNSWVNYTPVIAHRRNAEVIVPDRLDLGALRFIYCRSAAEKETLLSLLPSRVRHRYQRVILATSRTTLFEKRHTFVEEVRLSSRSARFTFSPDTKSPGPFHLRVELDDQSGHRYYSEEREFQANGSLSLNIPGSMSEYSICLRLDEHVAYRNSYYEEMEIPF